MGNKKRVFGSRFSVIVPGSPQPRVDTGPGRTAGSFRRIRGPVGPAASKLQQLRLHRTARHRSAQRVVATLSPIEMSRLRGWLPAWRDLGTWPAARAGTAVAHRHLFGGAPAESRVCLPAGQSGGTAVPPPRRWRRRRRRPGSHAQRPSGRGPRCMRCGLIESFRHRRRRAGRTRRRYNGERRGAGRGHRRPVTPGSDGWNAAIAANRVASTYPAAPLVLWAPLPVDSTPSQQRSPGGDRMWVEVAGSSATFGNRPKGEGRGPAPGPCGGARPGGKATRPAGHRARPRPAFLFAPFCLASWASPRGRRAERRNLGSSQLRLNVTDCNPPFQLFQPRTTASACRQAAGSLGQPKAISRLRCRLGPRGPDIIRKSSRNIGGPPPTLSSGALWRYGMVVALACGEIPGQRRTAPHRRVRKAPPTVAGHPLCDSAPSAAAADSDSGAVTVTVSRDSAARPLEYRTA